jgi:hypothetical protein
MLETDRLTQDDVRQIGGDEIRGVLVDWIERDYPIEKGLS